MKNTLKKSIAALVTANQNEDNLKITKQSDTTLKMVVNLLNLIPDSALK